MRKVLFSIIILALLAISISYSGMASQAMPRYAINEQTKECSEFFMGDECMSCTPPEGWEIIEEFQCPDDYNEIEENSVCRPYKSSFCCTVSHSGANGYCKDTVVNDIEKKCAFVENISECTKLPAEWKRADEIMFWGRVCPSLDYEWLEDPLDCETGIIDDKITNNQQSQDILLFMTGLVITVVIIWVLIMKKRQ
jgi:hypothetical protein